MPRSIYALFIVIIMGLTPERTCAQAVKEFRTGDGLVSLSMAPTAAVAESDSQSVPVSDFVLDTLSDLTALALSEATEDPLLEIHFQDHLTGEELRFPAKLSHLKDFLRSHGVANGGETADARTVAMVRALSVGMRVRMVAPVTGDAK